MPRGASSRHRRRGRRHAHRVRRGREPHGHDRRARPPDRVRYDERNQLIETILPDATPADLSDNPRTRNEYDDAGRETARIDELGRRTEYQYDALGRLVKTSIPTPRRRSLDNPFTQTEYDAAGQVIAQIDGAGNRTEFEYDANGHQTVRRDPLGNVTTTTTTPPAEAIAVTDPLGHTTTVCPRRRRRVDRNPLRRWHEDYDRLYDARAG